MSIYRRKSGRWAVLVDVDRGADGARRRRTLGTYGTRKDAERAERDALAARDRGIDISPGSLTVCDLFERFFVDTAPRLALKTAERYREIARLHIIPTLGNVRLAKLAPVHVSDLYAKLHAKESRGRTLSPRTVGHVHRLLHRVLRWAERLELVERNVARAVDPPKVRTADPQALTPSEVGRVLAAASPRWRPFITLAFLTGARRGELLGLSWSDVDFERKLMTIRRSLSKTMAGVAIKDTKTGRVRVVRLSVAAIEQLRALRVTAVEQRLAAGPSYAQSDFVFADELGRPYDPDRVSSTYRKTATRAGVSLPNLHAARHTVATRLLAAGTDVRTVAGILGHSAASTTLNVYGHLIADRASAAVDALGVELLGSPQDAEEATRFTTEGNRMATDGFRQPVGGHLESGETH